MLDDLLTFGNIIVFMFFVLCLVILVQGTKRPADIPPGPKSWIPLIGNLWELRAGDPRVPFREWRKKYGDIYSLYFGNKLVIVICGYENIKEAFVKNGDVFSERPDLYIFREISKGLGITSSSGHFWKEQRSFCLATLREFGFGKTSLEAKIEEEISPFLQVLWESKSQPLDIRRMLQISISNIICNMTFGHRFQYDNEEFLHSLQLIDDNFKVVGSMSALNIFPILRFIPFDPFKIEMVRRNHTKIDEYFVKIIEEHKQNFDENNIADLTDAYLKRMKKHSDNPDTSYTDSQLLRVIEDFFVGGTETITTALMWIFLYLLKFPEVQERMQNEIDSVIGKHRPPSLKDRLSLVYTEAVIMETLRVANQPGVSGLPHGVSKDTYFHGYKIPKEAIVFGNLDTVMNDPIVWKNTENFEPSRFIDDKGMLIRPEEFIPFFIGRRVCPGESLARMELFLFLTSIVQRFRITAPENEELPSLTGTFGLGHHPKPYRLCLIPR
ncbi:hypothetical protein ScPMuIL_010390 [Solemya velum]